MDNDNRYTRNNSKETRTGSSEKRPLYGSKEKNDEALTRKYQNYRTKGPVKNSAAVSKNARFGIATFVMCVVLFVLVLFIVYKLGGFKKDNTEPATTAAIETNEPTSTPVTTQDPVFTPSSPTPKSSITPSPTIKNTDPTVARVTPTPCAQEQAWLSKSDAFFKTAAFVGDSVMLGFQRYVLAKGSDFLGGPLFLVSGSLGVRNLVAPVSADSIHPMFRGSKRLVEDSISLAGSEKVFIGLGLNDINLAANDIKYSNQIAWQAMSESEQVKKAAEKVTEYYRTLTNNIKAKNPNVRIFVLATTYMFPGAEKTYLKNSSIRVLNEHLEAFAKEKGLTFINIAQYLVNQNGDLAPIYSSDQYVHQTTEAYDIWVTVLRNYVYQN